VLLNLALPATGETFFLEESKSQRTPKKKSSADQTVATICQEALRGAAAHYAVVRSTVKIDDILTLFQRLTGRSATPEEIADLEEKMGQKASSN